MAKRINRNPEAVSPVEEPMQLKGMNKPEGLHTIGKDEVREAAEIMRRYKQGKANLEQRIVENEKWFRMKNEVVRGSKGQETSRSAWLLNALLNKHADAMDNFPEPSVLPREQADEQDAKLLSQVLPVLLEQNEFEQVYSDVWWYKIKQGTGVHGVFWNNQKDGGLGDVEIKKVDLLNLYWEPGITDIQDSRHLFHATLWDADVVREMYPEQTKDLSAANTGELAQYVHDDDVNTDEKTLVVDWYYKKRGVLHFCKFTQEMVLYATENDPGMRDTGLYAHGRYPFVLDVLFPVETGPVGYGFIDLMRNPQELIDKLDMLILNNAAFTSKPRYFISDQAGINEKEFADANKDFVHVTGPINPNHLQPITAQALGAEVYTMRQYKIDELKETSGNRDVSTGGTSAGVTAASAIAAMQEAGSKISRDMIKSSYRAFSQVCYLVLDLIREFYTLPRSFRIVGEGGQNEYVTYQSDLMQQSGIDLGYGLTDGARKPIYDIKVKTNKANAYSRMAQNELSKELFGMGLFNPQLTDQALMVLDMMDFEGKEKIRAQVAQNGTMAQMIAQMQQQLMQMATIVDAQNGTTISQGMMQEAAAQQGAKSPNNVLYNDKEGGESGVTKNARERVANSTNPV